MIAESGSTTPGTYIAIVVAVLMLGLIGLGAWLLFKSRTADRCDHEDFLLAGFVCLATSLVGFGGIAWGMYPYSGEYHQWRATSGVVTSVDSRLISNGEGGSSERFVVELEEVGQRACDDTRCANLRKGDTLHLTCKRAWQFSGTDGYDCNFVAKSAGKK